MISCMQISLSLLDTIINCNAIEQIPCPAIHDKIMTVYTLNIPPPPFCDTLLVEIVIQTLARSLYLQHVNTEIGISLLQYYTSTLTELHNLQHLSKASINKSFKN